MHDIMAMLHVQTELKTQETNQQKISILTEIC
jgi:hypothetical protein